jgi:hypothetical protein
VRAALAALAALLLLGAVPAEAKRDAAAKSRCSVTATFVPGGKTRAGRAAWRRGGRVRDAVVRRCSPVTPKPNVGEAKLAPSNTTPTVPAPTELGEAAPAVPAAPVCTAGPSPWLGAIAEDVGGFRLRLTRTCMRAGRVLIDFQNRDLQPHNLYAEGIEPKVAAKRIAADLDGDESLEAETELSAGQWRVYCAIDGHEAMTQRLDVVSP